VHALGTRYALGFPHKDQGKASPNLKGYFSGLRHDMVSVENLSFEGKEPDLEYVAQAATSTGLVSVNIAISSKDHPTSFRAGWQVNAIQAAPRSLFRTLPAV
jgi:hypothetical protein